MEPPAAVGISGSSTGGEGEGLTYSVWSVRSHGGCEDDGAFGAPFDPRLGYGCGAVVGTEDLGDGSVRSIPFYIILFSTALALSSKI